MTQELQALLERINEDGVNKAQAERERIVGEAREEGNKIIENARTKAEKIVEQAEEDANLLVRKGEESLRQAGRDILLSLREQLQNRLAAVVKECLAADSDPEAFAKAIADSVKSQLENNQISELQVMVAKKDQATISQHLLAALGENLQKNVEITPVKDIESGFQLRFEGTDVIYDFSDSALTDTLTDFLGPKLAEIINSVEAKQNSKKS